MRVLFSFIGGTGHFLPLVPLARSAQRAGHEVAVAGSGGQVPLVRERGFRAYATSDPSATTVRSRRTAPVEVTGKEDAEIEFAENFAFRGASRHAAALPAIIEDFRPDVLVRDEADLGAVVAAELLGIPTVSVLVLAAGTLIRPDLVTPRLREVRLANGLPADPPGGREPVLSPFPPSLRAEGARPATVDVLFRAGDQVPTRDQADPPRVFMTLGTAFGLESGDLVDRLLGAAAQVRARVTVALGRHLDPTDFGPMPDHVRLERFVDQGAVLAHSDVVVSHGGSGTLLGALSHGLPQVLLPLGADQPHNAERATALGLGPVLDAATSTGSDVAHAIEEALTDPGPRASARAIQAEINALADIESALALVDLSAGD